MEVSDDFEADFRFNGSNAPILEQFAMLMQADGNVNVVLARDVLLKEVWGYESQIETNVVDVYIRYLRNKIDRPGEDSYIQTVRGTGYVMRS